MKLKVTTAFNDMSNADPDRRRREVGAEFEADDARAANLIALRLVEPVDPDMLHLTTDLIAPAATGMAATA